MQRTINSKRHFFFIDDIHKLNTKKDSSLLLATSLKALGHEVYLLFEKDFYVENIGLPQFEVSDFSAEFVANDFYLQNFQLLNSLKTEVRKGDFFHMRLDPPFDTRYMKYLWMQKVLEHQGVRVINCPEGILSYNEKLHAYIQPGALATYVGSSTSGLKKTLQNQMTDQYELIMKPIDLYQGMGVEKIVGDIDYVLTEFERKIKESGGAIVVQPFVKEVAQGEIRAIYFNGVEIGSILKVPKAGAFLANIAQGASYHAVELSKNVKEQCDRITKELKEVGVPWVAFDILGEHVSEINITCPGLLVEVSHAHNENMALKIAEMLA